MNTFAKRDTMGMSRYIGRPIFQAISLGFLLLVLYYPVVAELVRDWIVDDNYSHGFLIPVVSLFLVWRKREKLRSIPSGSSGMGLLVLIFGLLMLIVGSIAVEFLTQRLSLLVVIFGLLLYLGGRRLAGEFFFPLLYLSFMIPVPYIIYYSVSFPLELLASRWTTWVVQLMGIPIIREGNILYLESTTLQVIDACSGLRSLISLSALAAAMGYLTQRTIPKGLILFLTAVPVAIAANVLRLSVTAVLASLHGEQVAQGFLHQFSGIVVFIFAIICLSLVGGFLRWLSLGKDTGSPSVCC
jgi:exosortase